MTCTNKEQKTILKYELKETAIDIFSGTRQYSVFQVMQELQKGFKIPYFYQQCPILPLLLCHMHLEDKIGKMITIKLTNM